MYVGFFLLNFHFTLPGGVKSGDLDIYLTKPISTQFSVTTRYVEFPTIIPDVIGGLVVTVIAWNRLNIGFDVLKIAAYFMFIVSGVIIAYSIFFCFSLLSFVLIQNNAVNKLSQSLLQFNNMPMTIYNKTIRHIGIFLLPIFMVTNLPMLFVMNRLSAGLFIWGIAAPVVFFVISRVLFKCALKRYHSASS